MKNSKPNRQRSIRIDFFVNQFEHDLIDKRMKYFGYKTRSKYIRDVSIKSKITQIDTSHFEEILSQIKGVSRNINQVTKYIHESGLQ